MGGLAGWAAGGWWGVGRLGDFYYLLLQLQTTTTTTTSGPATNQLWYAWTSRSISE